MGTAIWQFSQFNSFFISVQKMFNMCNISVVATLFAMTPCSAMIEIQKGDHVMFPEKYLYGYVPSEAGAEQKLVIGKIKGTLDGKRLGIIPGTPRKYENIEYWRIQPKCYADGSTLATEVY